jgi:hypothetical protein
MKVAPPQFPILALYTLEREASKNALKEHLATTAVVLHATEKSVQSVKCDPHDIDRSSPVATPSRTMDYPTSNTIRSKVDIQCCLRCHTVHARGQESRLHSTEEPFSTSTVRCHPISSMCQPWEDHHSMSLNAKIVDHDSFGLVIMFF